jgi:nucleotide-binding universal stress UspA family protein
MAKILVPIDGSELSDAAVTQAEAMARETNAEIVLMSVTEKPETSELSEDAEDAAKRSLHDYAARLSVPSSIRVHQTGDPVRGILRAIEEEAPAAVVMATSDPSGLDALVDRSVAEEVQKSTKVPVVLVVRQ